MAILYFTDQHFVAFYRLKFSKSISDVNVNYSAKLKKVSMFKSWISKYRFISNFFL